MRDAARHAVRTGRQLWPAATLAEHRLALLAPPRFVAVVLSESDGLSGRFTIGPLTEVAAQHHSWPELAPVLEPGPRSAIVAHERALRGDSVADDLPDVLDIPTRLQPWEPAYPLATYSDSGLEAPPPDLPPPRDEIDLVDLVDVLDRPSIVTDAAVDLAFRQLVEPWLTASNGRAETVCVDGGVAGGLAAMGLRRARTAALTPQQGIAWLVWAGASGGAHGRRRGAAAGRFGAWWLVGAIGDLHDDWPPEPDELGELVAELQWYRWDAFEPELGWSLQLAIHDPVEGLSWLLVARDTA